MGIRFAKRKRDVPKSFIREILKNGGGDRMVRLNYFNADESTIKGGVQRLAQAWESMG